MIRFATATLNCGRGAIHKGGAIARLIEDCTVVALQEIDVNIHSAESFVQFWASLNWHCVLGGLHDGRMHRICVLARLPLRRVQLEPAHGFDDRILACHLGSHDPIMFSCIYGHATDEELAHATATAEVRGLQSSGRPWLLMGDFNLQPCDLENLWTRGCRALDDAFDDLPGTSRSGRRIDFGVAGGLVAIALHHDVGVADHSSVCYDVDLEYTSYMFASPSRAPQRRLKEEVQALFALNWHAEQFEALLVSRDVDAAWSLLSDIAERSIFTDVDRGAFRSEAWSLRRFEMGHRKPHIDEPVALRRLRRFLRRLSDDD